MSGLLESDPITFAHLLSTSYRLVPGDIILMHSGTYSGNYNLSFSGTAPNYITLKNYPGERVVIDGQLTLSGNYLKIIGLEIINSTARDRSAQVGTVGFSCIGDYNVVANCLIHDHDQGLTNSAAKTGHVYYGNLFYFNGWDGGNGHGIYPQNNAGNTKTLKRNLIFDNFSHGIHAWGSSGDVSNFTIDGNVCFENGSPRNLLAKNILNGNQSSFTSPIIHNNLTYNRVGQGGNDGKSQVGYGSGNQALDVSVYDNYFVNDGNALTFVDATIARFDGNTLIGTLAGADIGTNTQILTGYPTGTTNIFLTDNEYDANRGQLVIYNWGLSNTVVVDVSSIYAPNDVINVHNVQDYWVDIQQLTVSGGGTITINMQAANRTAATAVGWSATPKTFPQFGAFVLQKA